MSEPICVVLASMQDPLVTDLISSALRKAGMSVSAVETQEEAFVAAASEPGVPVVIVPRIAPYLGEVYANALRENPRLRLLVVIAMKERADLLELRLLGSDVGYRGVVEAVRAAVAAPHAMDETSEVAAVVRAVAQYLLDNPLACDTVDGICRWWLSPDLNSMSAVTGALARMKQRELVEELVAADDRLRYRRSATDTELRAVIARAGDVETKDESDA